MEGSLQNRPEADDLNGRFLTFKLQDAVYGIELFSVTEIIKVQPIIRVPGVVHYIQGIINLRGKIVPVIDVRLKLGYAPAAHTDKTCIIVVMIQEMQVGLIVDEVYEVMTISQAECTPPPHGSAEEEGVSRYLSSIATAGGRIIMMIDCQKFFAEDLEGILPR